VHLSLVVAGLLFLGVNFAWLLFFERQREPSRSADRI